MDKINHIMLLFFVMLILMGACMTHEAVPEIPEIEEMILVHSGILADACMFQKLDPSRLLLARSTYWILKFEEGPVIMIKESPFWFCPRGKKVNVYEYRNRLAGKSKYYIEQARKE